MNLGAPLRFLYENGKAFGFLVNEATAYFYIKNLHGDVVQIVGENGNTMVTYSYDSWGNELSAIGDETLLALNPFTYRGYQYDRETGLYYLQARYYNPQWGRFINADTNMDTQTSVIGTNIFAYCDNNPVMRVDQTGHESSAGLTEQQKVFWSFLDHIKTFLNRAGICGEIVGIKLEFEKFVIGALLAEAIEVVVSLTIGIAVGWASSIFKIAKSALVGGGLTATLEALQKAKDIIDSSELSKNAINIIFSKIQGALNPFSNIIPGNYYSGVFSITEELVRCGPYITYKFHVFNFIFGPSGTSLDRYIYNSWEAVLRA